MPRPFVFRPGVRYTIQKDDEHTIGYEILDILKQDNLLVRNVAAQDDRSEVQSMEALRRSLWEGKLKFGLPGRANLRKEAGSPFTTSYDFATLADLPIEVQSITENRFALVEPLLELTPRQRSDTYITEHVDDFIRQLLVAQKPGGVTVLFGEHIGKGKGPRKKKDAEAHGEVEQTEVGDEGEQEAEQTEASDEGEQGDGSAAPSPDSGEKPEVPTIACRTVRRWVRLLEESGGDIRSLVPSYHRNGPQKMYTPPDEQAVIREAIKKVFKRDRRAPITEVIDEVKRLVKKKNKKRAANKQLRTPSARTIRRFIAHLDPQERWELGMDRDQKGPSNDAPGQGPRPTRPNERWEFDFARLDILVVDAYDRLPIGRPVIAAIRDKYTGYPVAIVISFEPPSYRLVMECLMYAILEKTWVKELYNTENDYLAYGVPETLVVDNAMELHRDLKQACLQLGIKLDHTRVRSPWLKGAIERWFKTLNIDLIHRLPGTTFSHFLERGDYHSEKHACMTLDGLCEALHIWIVDEYTQDKHRGVGPHWATEGIPAQLWKDALQQDFVPALPPSREVLLVLVSRTTERTIEHYGIEFENLVYQGSALQALRHKMRLPEARTRMKWQGQAGKVRVKFYPGDLSRLWVLDPFTLHYIEVKAVNQEYTRGLSLWKHLVIKRFVREELKRKLNEDALLRAKERIQHIVKEEFRQTRKIRSRLGAARWLDMQVMSWEGTASVSPSPDAPADEPEDGDDAAGEEPENAGEQPQGASATGERVEPSPLAEGAPSGGRVLPADEPGGGSGAEEGSKSLDARVVPAIGVSPPPKISGITLVSAEETAEVSNPITQLPEMPTQPAQAKKKNRKRGKLESVEERPPSAQEERASETTANRPRSYGISVSYARPLANEPAGGKK
jgi:putative transposase